MGTSTDRRALRRSSWKKSGEALWEDLVRCHGERLEIRIRYILRKGGVEPQPDQVEEMVQEVYCRLLTHGSERLDHCLLHGETLPAGYLERIAERVAIDELRAWWAGRQGRFRLVPLGGREGSVAERAVDPDANPEDRFLRGEERKLFLTRCRAAAARAFGRRTRRRNLRILHLAFLEGWSSREIARAEGGRLAPSTVDTVVYRARRMLESRIGGALPSR